VPATGLYRNDNIPREAFEITTAFVLSGITIVDGNLSTMFVAAELVIVNNIPTELLVGPVTAANLDFWYDNFEVSIPFYAPTDLTISGNVKVSGSVTFK